MTMSTEAVKDRHIGKCRVLEGQYLTTGDLVKLFGRTNMTIYTWRRDLDLPYVVIPSPKKDAIRFEVQDVIDWAKENDFYDKINQKVLKAYLNEH